MRPLPTILTILALLAALFAVGYLLFGPSGPSLDEIPTSPRVRPETDHGTPRGSDLPMGGVFAGIVVDEEGEGIADAGVMLVAYDSGAQPPAVEGVDTPVDVPDIVVIGNRAGPMTRTDVSGRFRVTADARDAVRMVCAWQRGYALRLVNVAGPSEEIRIVLKRAGQFEGRVVDDETGDPVPGARAYIYMQNRVVPPDGGPKPELSPLAAAQQFVARVLGPLVYGLQWHGGDALMVWTDDDGIFRFGPVGDEIQLEFVIQHPVYKWAEHDLGEDDRVRRTVVAPGETVTRTFRLTKGKFIEGIVVDETGKGVEGVRVAAEGLPQYHEHWWYRIKSRVAVSGSGGRFRVGGLSWGPYNVTLQHPTFGKQTWNGIEENSKGLRLEVQRVGAIRGLVEGLNAPEEQGLRQADLMLEAVEEVAGGGQRHRRRRVRLSRDRVFLADRLPPGRWNAWVQAGRKASQPEIVEVKSHDVVDVTFRLGGGGSFELNILDVEGSYVDPALVRLVGVAADGKDQHALGSFTTREGRLDASGVVPGRYRALVSAPGYLASATQPFDIRADAHLRLDPVVLAQQAFMSVVDVRGMAADVDVTISVREGDGPFKQFRSGFAPSPIRPGSVTVRAVSSDGLSFEQEYEVAGGETLNVEILLE